MGWRISLSKFILDSAAPWPPIRKKAAERRHGHRSMPLAVAQSMCIAFCWFWNIIWRWHWRIVNKVQYSTCTVLWCSLCISNSSSPFNLIRIPRLYINPRKYDVIIYLIRNEYIIYKNPKRHAPRVFWIWPNSTKRRLSLSVSFRFYLVDHDHPSTHLIDRRTNWYIFYVKSRWSISRQASEGGKKDQNLLLGKITFSHVEHTFFFFVQITQELIQFNTPRPNTRSSIISSNHDE